MQVGFLNELDLLLLVIFLISGLYGMTRGAVPQIVSAISLWLGIVIALWLYTPLSHRIIKGVFQGWSFQVSDTLAFFILFGIFFHTVRLIILYLVFPPESDEAAKKAEIRRKKKREKEGLDESMLQRYILGPLNLIVGMFMGVILAVLWWSIIIGMLQFILQPSLAPAGALANLAFSMRRSYLVFNILNQVLIYLSMSVDLFRPAYATILRDIVQLIVGMS
jgi:uncharacterized membrane protein required for colicin V production